MKTRIQQTALALGMGILFAACAGSPRREAASAARAKDSAPEKIAAQRAASRNLQLEGEEDRWGVEAARERRRLDKQQKAAPLAEPAPKGPVDLRRPTQTPPVERP